MVSSNHHTCPTLCQEPAWEFPPMTKVMPRGLICKGESGLKGPPWTYPSIYPQTKICLCYYFMTFTNSSDINGGLSQTTFLCKKINLKLQLISLLGIIGVFKSKPLRRLSNLPDRFSQTPIAMHTIVYSLPAMRGIGSLRYSNSIEPLGSQKLLEQDQQKISLLSQCLLQSFHIPCIVSLEVY